MCQTKVFKKKKALRSLLEKSRVFAKLSKVFLLGNKKNFINTSLS